MKDSPILKVVIISLLLLSLTHFWRMLGIVAPENTYLAWVGSMTVFAFLKCYDVDRVNDYLNTQNAELTKRLSKYEKV